MKRDNSLNIFDDLSRIGKSSSSKPGNVTISATETDAFELISEETFELHVHRPFKSRTEGYRGFRRSRITFQIKK